MMKTDRMKMLLVECISWIQNYGTYEQSLFKDALDNIGFTNDELKELGYDYLCTDEEEDEI